jgi:hypothetical protein
MTHDDARDHDPVPPDRSSTRSGRFLFGIALAFAVAIGLMILIGVLA